MNNTQDKDPLLAKLLSQLPMEEPSDGFTQRIMSFIQQPEVVNTEYSSFFVRYRYWLIALLAVALLIISTIFFPSFIGHTQIESLHKFFNPYISAFNSISLLLKMQPIISIVIFALVGLFLIDKLLSRMFHPNIQHS